MTVEAIAIGRFIRQRFEQAFQHRVQAAGADVLGAFVHLVSDFGDPAHAAGVEVQRHAFGRQQRFVLRAQRGIGLGEDANEVLDLERIQFDADREAALQLGNQIRRLGHVERAGGDEQDVIRLHHAVLGGHRAAFHQRQQVALHAFARHVGAVRFLAAGDLVDLVDEHDAVLLGVLQRAQLQLFLVDHLGGFFVREQLECFTNFHFARLGARAAEVGEHALQLLRQVFHAGGRHDLHADRQGAHFDFDLAIVELAFAQHLAKFLARFAVARVGLGFGSEAHRLRARQQCVEHALFGGVHGAMANLLHLFFARHLDRDIHQILDDGIDLAADIADFGELGGFDFDERRTSEPREATGNLGLADAGRADHQNVFRRDFGAQRFGHLHAAPAIAQARSPPRAWPRPARQCACRAPERFLWGSWT